MPRGLSKPIRTVLKWQLLVTGALAVAGGGFLGLQGAASAGAGGLVSVVASLAAAVVAPRGGNRSAGRVLLGALRAEAVRIAVALVLLLLVLTNYEKLVIPLVLGSFVVTMLMFTMAFFVRDY